MKIGIVVFPGSNCELDTRYVLKNLLGQEVIMLWHEQRDLEGSDVVILPGGFSYGDYLRTGAIARFSPIMESVIEFAAKGNPVVGICNGFQILLECGLLPGALVTNGSLKFISDDVIIKVETDNPIYTSKYESSQLLKMPIAHIGGSFFADDDTLEEIESDGRVAFRYCDAKGNANSKSNPNASLGNIAGIYNKEGNVLGLMPHPERASESLLGSTDGLGLFESLISFN
ncbi:phosphoribosylformylglycinamidine synthase subunit PurQ [Candidatus Marinimicrobia bacterium MT.SAG.3]|nr:phosphoribosylformylglycinamidine synthase subunit PurQ [Candidatus Marinimicrobia bacterium MT.SAG.3]